MPRQSTLTGTFVVLLASTVQVSAQSTVYLNKQTWYGYPDNGVYGGESGSSGTAFSCEGRGYTAGGSGSYDSPLTYATASGSDLHNPCQISYFPFLEKYLVMQDTCGGCSGDQIDVWIGNGNGGSSEESCEDNAPSGNGHNLILNAASGSETNSGCAVSGNVYSGNS